MKSEVNKPVTSKYPALYEHEDGDVILVIEDSATTFVGTVVKSDCHKTGWYCTDWLKSSWTRMEPGTTVTLTQP